jgi:heat shock protein HslJ
MPRTSFRFVSLLFPALFVQLFFGCGSGCSVGNGAAAGEATTVHLEDTDWILVELNGEAITVAEPMMRPSIRFDREAGLAAGNSGVNQFSGGYTLADGSIEFGPMRSTMMAGPPEAMEREADFMKALDAMTGWRIVDGRLELLDGETVIAGFLMKPQDSQGNL